MDQDELIWKYIDGHCDLAEKAAFEQLLTTDPSFKKAFEERQVLDQGFQSLTLEEPSMRFTTNVMENLPLLYQKLPARQLLGPVWIKAFWTSLSFLMVSALGIGFLSPDTATSTGTYSNEITRNLIDVPQSLFLPYKSALILLAISSSLILLVMIDKRLDKARKNRQTTN
jgi:hypothetical protein